MAVANTGAIRAQTLCDLDCLSNKIDALNKRVTALELAAIPRRATAAPTKAAARTTYVAISGGNVATASDWTKVDGSDFWLDLSLYGNVSQVTWEGWIDSGNGQARLYDATNNRVVDGSQITITSNTRASFYSKPLSIWRGQNKYYVELKSLVAGQASISTPRLRIVTN